MTAIFVYSVKVSLFAWKELFLGFYSVVVRVPKTNLGNPGFVRFVVLLALTV